MFKAILLLVISVLVVLWLMPTVVQIVWWLFIASIATPIIFFVWMVLLYLFRKKEKSDE